MRRPAKVRWLRGVLAVVVGASLAAGGSLAPAQQFRRQPEPGTPAQDSGFGIDGRMATPAAASLPAAGTASQGAIGQAATGSLAHGILPGGCVVPPRRCFPSVWYPWYWNYPRIYWPQGYGSSFGYSTSAVYSLPTTSYYSFQPQNFAAGGQGRDALARDGIERQQPADEPAAPRVSSTAKSRAKRLIEFGDRYFREQDYHKASFRYRDAAKLLPSLADAHFRYGQALIALGKYDKAAAAFKRGIEANPEWAKSSFRLDLLYGAHLAAHAEQLTALEEAAEAVPTDADLQFLIGLQHYFGGRPLESREFFLQAATLDDERFHLVGFLRETEALEARWEAARREALSGPAEDAAPRDEPRGVAF